MNTVQNETVLPPHDPIKDDSSVKEEEDAVFRVAAEALKHAEFDEKVRVEKKESIFKRIWKWIKGAFTFLIRRITGVSQKTIPTSQSKQISPSNKKRKYELATPQRDFADDVRKELHQLREEVSTRKLDQANAKELHFEIHENIAMLREQLSANKQRFPEDVIESLRESLTLYELIARQLLDRVRTNREQPAQNESCADDVVVTGIKNIGNSCYMNASIQSLLHSPVFLSLLENPPTKGERESDKKFAERKEIIEAVRNVHMNYQTKNTLYLMQAMKTLRSLAFTTQIGKECGFDGNMRSQYDTEQFVRLIMHAFGVQFSLVDERTVRHETLEFPHVSQSPESLLHLLELSFPEGRSEGVSIQEMLDNDFKLKQQEDVYTIDIDDDVKLACQDWDQKTSMTSHPPLLPIRVKRFKVKQFGCTHVVEKINREVNVGNGTLNLQKAFDPEESVMYRLRGFAVHRGGSIENGHYVGYVRSDDGQWHYVNDSSTKEKTEEEVFEDAQNGYVFFYELVNND